MWFAKSKNQKILCSRFDSPKADSQKVRTLKAYFFGIPKSPDTFFSRLVCTKIEIETQSSLEKKQSERLLPVSI